MARIFMSMSGEGRGHAARIGALVEHLHHHHELHVFAPGAAFDLLKPLGERYGCEILRIPGITNRYTADRRFNLWATGLAVNDYVMCLPRLIERLEARMYRYKPELVITDFEPALPRAAERCGIPFMSIDHQHVLVVSDLSSLPPRLQWHAFWMGQVVRRFYGEPCASVVSSFYRPPLKPQYSNVSQVGVLLRSAVHEAVVEEGDHLVAYFRRFAPAEIIESLIGSRCPVRVYGLGLRGRYRNLEFKEIHGENFLEDLASCRALVATAGNQLVGEALYLRKPVMVMPEPRNFEQAVNAHFLQAIGAGVTLDSESCGRESVRKFLKKADAGGFHRELSGLDGTGPTLAAIEEVLARNRQRDLRRGRPLEAA